jgi:RNA polymerase sigma-70 factor (ECF subfamily)
MVLSDIFKYSFCWFNYFSITFGGLQMRKYQLYDNDLLLELLSKDDELAFTELYSRYWKKLFAVAYNRLKEIQSAEDVVHDVFASLWANRRKSKMVLLENYLATATKYMVFAKIKKILKERNYSNDSHQTPLIDLPIETSLHYKRILEIIKIEVEKLPEKCKVIFKFSRNDGMSVKMIAKKLDISPKTVENQLNKALRQLKQATLPYIRLF